MRLLVIGGGAREHAIVWKLAQSPRVAKLYCAPGNPGTTAFAESVPLAIKSAADIPALVTFAEKHQIDLTIVGPEDPLVFGVVDAFQARGLVAFGPTAAGAQIEGSKSWAKELMARCGVPTAVSIPFDAPEPAREYARTRPLPIVVKADGVAAGKGVTIAQTLAEALAAIDECMIGNVFGAAGARIVIEECLVGPEVSVIALVDGTRAVPLIPACDYKPVFDGNRGPNTGGMGSYVRPRFVGEDLYGEIQATVLDPIVAGLRAAGIDYRGVLYAGLMLTAEGPKVLEFNARFGDPETQAILPMLASDLVDVVLATIEGRLTPELVRWHPGTSCGVVLASGGYPGHYEIGKEITGLDQLDADVPAFHAGTRLESGRLVTAGGRVITVVARGQTMAEAREKAYSNVARVAFAGRHYRTDIALREVES